jgi:hypothetical protein
MRGTGEAARYGIVARTFCWDVLCSYGSRIEHRYWRSNARRSHSSRKRDAPDNELRVSKFETLKRYLFWQAFGVVPRGDPVLKS